MEGERQRRDAHEFMPMPPLLLILQESVQNSAVMRSGALCCAANTMPQNRQGDRNNRRFP